MNLFRVPDIAKANAARGLPPVRESLPEPGGARRGGPAGGAYDQHYFEQNRELADRLGGRAVFSVQAAASTSQVIVIAVVLVSCALYSLAWVGGWYDDNAYHIPSAVRIAKSLNPYHVDSPVDSHWFPAGAETVVAVFVWLTGSLYAVNLSGTLCLIALATLTYRLTAVWSPERQVRFAAVACVCTVPLMIGQCLAFYVDIHMAVVVVLTLYLCCRCLVTRRAESAYLALAALVLAPSVKYSGLLFVAVLAPGILYCLWRASPPRKPGIGGAISLCLAVAFTTGWYVRNWMLRGNPLYPFCLPQWVRPVFELTGKACECDPEHGFISPSTAWPHPVVPKAWLRHAFAPDMTHDAFGASFAFTLGCCLLSLFVLHKLDPPRRRAWLFVVVMCLAVWAATPLGRRVPRYLLFLPVVSTGGLAVVAAAARGRVARWGVQALCIGVLLFSATYAYVNIVSPPTGRNALRAALGQLWPYRPQGIVSYDYVQRGGLRIGYTSGSDNFIAMLYDSGLTNELIPLHYKNAPYNYWREFDSPEAFVEHVRSLHLDYIHVFDDSYPGVDLLVRNFPEKIRGRPRSQ